jgi:hypothetical protein
MAIRITPSFGCELLADTSVALKLVGLAKPFKHPGTYWSTRESMRSAPGYKFYCGVLTSTHPYL